MYYIEFCKKNHEGHEYSLPSGFKALCSRFPHGFNSILEAKKEAKILSNQYPAFSICVLPHLIKGI